MRKFLPRFLAFFLPVLIAALVLVLYVRQKHFFLHSTGYHANQFNSAFQELDHELIAIGNSKLLASLDQPTLEKGLEMKTANLGYSSSNLSISKLTLETYLNQCKAKPKAVLMEVSWITFNTNRTHFHKVAGEFFLRDFKLWKHFTKYPKIHHHLRSTIKKNFHLKRSQFDSTIYYGKLIAEGTAHTKDYEFKIEDFERIFPNHVAGIDDLLLDDFNWIVEKCKEENIELILYSAPEDEEYSRLQTDIDPIKKIFHKAAENDHIYYLDYTLGGGLWKKEYEFWLRDSHHVNEFKLFTESLVQDIKSRSLPNNK